jgi:hypothetical protein
MSTREELIQAKMVELLAIKEEKSIEEEAKKLIRDENRAKLVDEASNLSKKELCLELYQLYNKKHLSEYKDKYWVLGGEFIKRKYLLNIVCRMHISPQYLYQILKKEFGYFTTISTI